MLATNSTKPAEVASHGSDTHTDPPSEDILSSEESPHSSPPITLFCRPDGSSQICHPCRKRGGHKECRYCHEDLAKLEIFETLPPEETTVLESDSLSDDKPRGILFCRKSELCHTCMIKYGWATCSYCNMDFAKLSHFCFPPEESKKNTGSPENDSETRKQAEEDEQEDSNQIASGAVATHSVEYLYSSGNSMGMIPWSGRFDLAKARLDARKARLNAKEKTKKSPAFEMFTKVATSVESMSSFDYKSLRDGLNSIIESEEINLTIQTTDMEILSGDIIKSLAGVVSYYPSVKLGGHKLVLEEPYDIVAHHLQPLEKLRSSNKDLGLFLDFIQEFIFKDSVRQEKDRNAKGMCTFRMLWLLFKPGDTIYTEVDGEYLAFVISSVTSPEGILSSSKALTQFEPYELTVWNLDFNGQYVGRCQRDIEVEPFEGERNITTLKMVPCRFIDDGDGGATRRRLEELGRRWYELLPGRSIQYSGITKAKKKVCNILDIFQM